MATAHMMKLFMLIFAYLLAVASARVAQPWVRDHNIFAAADERPLYLPYPFATDDYYNTCKCKSENFWKAMHSSSADAGALFKPVRDTSESSFTDTSALSTWEWKDATVPASSFQFDKAWGVDHILRAIGVSDKATRDGGTIEVVKLAHGDSEANGGGYGITPYNSRQPTPSMARATALRVASTLSGLILAESFSDVAWLKWKEAGGNAPSTMRYFASISITNIETRGVLSKVLDKAAYKEVPAWPGYDEDANTEEGAALLGTSNAIAFSYFLVQHKPSLGILKVSKITLFKNNMKSPDPCMLFHVEKAEEDESARDRL